MSRRVTDWLRSESLPRNAYELLGHPLLDPNRDALLQTLRTANREVLDYQSHPEPAVSKRAMFLLTELGRYRGILEDAAKHQAYVEDLCKTLREQFVAERDTASLFAANQLAGWLGLAYGVASGDSDRVVQAVRGSVPPPQTLPKRGSKFGAFQSPSAEPIEAEVIEVVEPPAPPVVAEVYDLSDAPAAAPRPQRKPARLEPVDRAPQRLPGREKESSIAIPLAIGGGVLLLLAVVAAVVIALSGEPEQKQVRNEPPPEQKTTDEPKVEPKVETKPKEVDPPESKKLPDSSEAEKKKERDRLEKERKDRERKLELERLENERKERERQMELDRLEKERLENERKDRERKELERLEKERKEIESRDWTKADGGKGDFLVKDVVLRVHSLGFQRLVDEAKSNATSGDVLVIWLEALNRGTVTRRYKRLMEWESGSYQYSYMTLRDDNKVKSIERPQWLNYDRRLKGMPQWFDEEHLSREIPTGRPVLIPLIFENQSKSKEFTLTVKAVRLIGESGNASKADDYGTYKLTIGKGKWDNAPPMP